MQKNQIYTSVATGYGTEGEAVFIAENTPVFVPYCIDGESAEIKILAVKGGAAYGKCERILNASPQRVQPACPLFEKCGGCQLQHMQYSAQLDFKTNLVKNALRKIAGIEAEVLPAHASSQQYRYRNKLVLPVGTEKDGKTVVGFYAARSHRKDPAEARSVCSRVETRGIEPLTS